MEIVEKKKYLDNSTKLDLKPLFNHSNQIIEVFKNLPNKIFSKVEKDQNEIIESKYKTLQSLISSMNNYEKNEYDIINQHLDSLEVYEKFKLVKC
jgi:hypothetical protein